MKKTLLLLSVTILLSFGLKAQEWIFGNDIVNFPVNPGITSGNTLTINGLLITAGGTGVTNMGQVEASSKTFGTSTYINRFKFNGAGYSGAAATDVTPTVNMPTQRFVSFAVTGNSTFIVHGITGSSGSDRKIFITDGTNFIGSIPMPGSQATDEATFNYTGPAKTLYMFGNASFNLYYLKVSSLTTSVKEKPAIKGISFNGTQVLNEKGQKIELYTLSGKLINRSSSSISTENLPKGVYIVRVTGSNGILKFCK